MFIGSTMATSDAITEVAKDNTIAATNRNTTNLFFTLITPALV
jgi:hypothetical protein